MSGNGISQQHTRAGRKIGIATKILVAASLALITGLVIVGGAALYLEKQALVGLQLENSLTFVKIMGDEIKNAMLAGEIKKIDAYFKDVIESKRAVALSVYDDKGEERGSGAKGNALVAEVLKSNKPASSEGIQDGTHILETILPLPNEERCQSCHDKETKILGALKLTTSIEQGYVASRKATLWLLVSGGGGTCSQLFVSDDCAKADRHAKNQRLCCQSDRSRQGRRGSYQADHSQIQ